MRYKLTNKNIRIRYLAAKDSARIQKKLGSIVPAFSYGEMAKLFMVTKQACYEWTTKKLPSGPRREAVYQWINDGEIDAFLGRMEGRDGC